MALHSELEIYRTCYDLLGDAAQVVSNMRREIKGVLGSSIMQACVQLDIHLRRANMAQDKEAALLDLLEALEVIEISTRVCRDRRWIPLAHYAKLAAHTQSIGMQCNAWRTWMKDHGSPQQRQLFDSQGSRDRA